MVATTGIELLLIQRQRQYSTNTVYIPINAKTIWQKYQYNYHHDDTVQISMQLLSQHLTIATTSTDLLLVQRQQ